MRLSLSLVIVMVAMASAHPTSSIYKKGGTKLDWWQNTVFYQVYPRSFKDSDGDGIGDIKGIISKLDYLRDLGVGGTWLSPIFKSPMADFGYDISDFYAIDPIFGTMEDIEELFRLANERGMKIILDFVPNHSSEQCEWFQKSIKRIEPYTDYYVWHNGRNVSGKIMPPNNWDQVFYGTAWTWNTERQQYYYHTFAKEQPDFNFHNPLLVEEMKNILRFWIKKGAAGFRVDATNHIFEVDDFRDEPVSGKTNDTLNYKYTLHHFTRDQEASAEMVYQWREVLDAMKEENGGYSKILMTEAYSNNTFLRKFYQSDDDTRQGSHVPLNFALIDEITEYTTAADFKTLIDDRLVGIPDGKWVSWIIGNHDQYRIGTRMGEGRIDCFLTLVMTLPGVAITYQGEEIGMMDYRFGMLYNRTYDPQARNLGELGNWKERSRDPERTPFQWDSSKWAGFSQGNKEPWLPIHPNYKELNLAEQKRARRSTFKYYKQLIQFRTEETMIFGDYNSKVMGSNVLAYTRSLADHETYVVLLNLGAREETLNIHELVNGFAEYSEIVLAGAETTYDTGDIVPTNAVFLRKYHTVVLKSAPDYKPNEPSSADRIPVSFLVSFVLAASALRIIF